MLLRKPLRLLLSQPLWLLEDDGKIIVKTLLRVDLLGKIVASGMNGELNCAR